jgi:hypothetical protein
MAKANRDFEELFACFRRHEVKAVVIGAHALAFHARPRYTKDIDVFVEATSENAERILAALEAFGFGSLDLSADDFAAPGKIVHLGVEPNRVDLTTTVHGIDFDEAWKGRVEGRYGSERVFYLGREELKRNKRASGRLQDLADLELLEQLEQDGLLGGE